jgi:hypothetical protein
MTTGSVRHEQSTRVKRAQRPWVVEGIKAENWAENERQGLGEVIDDDQDEVNSRG